MKRGERTTVTLQGGPFDGVKVAVVWGTHLFAEIGSTGAGAKYGPSREPGIYTYRGKDRVVARIPTGRAD